MPELNSEQKAAVESILAKLKKSERFLSLIGGGGTGKTFTVMELIRSLSGTTVCVAAPTNKVKNRIAKAMGGLTNVTFRTIASLLGKQPDFDDKGRVVFLGKTREYNFSLLVIDEASMVNEEDLNALLHSLEEDVSILGVGDDHQHFPVKSYNSPLFDIVPPENVHRLDRIMRQTEGNPVSAIIAKCKEQVKKPLLTTYDLREDFTHNVTDTQEGFYELPERTLHRQLILAWKTALARNNPDLVRCIGYRNNTARKWNKLVRYGSQYDPSFRLVQTPEIDYQPGELLVNKSPITQKVFMQGMWRTITLIDNGEICTVLENHNPITIECKFLVPDIKAYDAEGNLKTKKNENGELVPVEDNRIEYRWQYPGHLITVESETGVQYQARLIDYDAIPKWQEDIKLFTREVYAPYKKRGLLVKYQLAQMYKCTNHMEYAYCTNSHIEQGSTYENVFLLLDDVLSVPVLSGAKSNKEKIAAISGLHRALYVIVSRCQKRLFIENIWVDKEPLPLLPTEFIKTNEPVGPTEKTPDTEN